MKDGNPAPRASYTAEPGKAHGIDLQLAALTTWMGHDKAGLWDKLLNDNGVYRDIKNLADSLVFACHGASFAGGWWHDVETGEPIQPNIGEKLMLIVSEVSEGLEGDRKRLMDDKLPHRPMLEVELADAVIRICDLVGALGLDLGGAIVEKMRFNAKREDHKPENRAAGGKAY